MFERKYLHLTPQQLSQAIAAAVRGNKAQLQMELAEEAEMRKRSAVDAQGRRAAEQLEAIGPRTVADQVMSGGIAALPAESDERGYASGGIVAFSGGGAASLFEQFLQGRGYSMAEYARLSPQMQQAMQQAFNISNAYPAASPVPPAGAAAPATGSGYGAQPATYGQRALSGAGAVLKEMPKTPAALLLAGGTALTAGSANALSNATDEQLEQLSNYGGDTSLAAAIIREGRNTPKKAAPAKPTVKANMSDGRGTSEVPGLGAYVPRYTAPKSKETPPARDRVGEVSTSSGIRVSGPGRAPSTPATAPAPADEGIMSLEARLAKLKDIAAEENKEWTTLFDKQAARDEEMRKEMAARGAAGSGIFGLSQNAKDALFAAGLSMIGKKNLNEGLQAASEAGLKHYEGSKAEAKTQQELLRKAADARDAARLAAKQGNLKAAGEFMAKHDEYVNKIQDNRRADRELEQTGRYQDRMAGAAEMNARNQGAYQNARIRMLQDADKLTTQERKEYAALLKQAQDAVDKDPMLLGKPDSEKQAAVAARLRSMLTMNPWLSKYAGGIGFTSAPAGGKTYDLTAEE